MALRPSDRESATRELERVQSVRDLLGDGEFGGMPAIPVASDDLRQLQVDGSVLLGPALLRIGVLLESSRLLQAELGREGVWTGPLSPLRERLVSDTGSEQAIAATLDRDGNVRDGASRELGRIRRETRSVQSSLVRALEKTMSDLPDRFRVEDASVTIRSGRYVIPLRREGKSQVGGIVHDQSATGATLFVEPPGQVERMNRLRELELAEAREVHRILGERSAQIRPLHPALVGSLDALVDFDGLYARARSADAWGGTPPRIGDVETDALVIVDGRHPLLVERGVSVVPFSLSLEMAERVLVVSGPNTGGKSVLLKTVGLVPALALCGVVPPSGPGTVVPAFTAFHADIGDEQSIQEDLSTFSAHVAHLRAILSAADSGALVLLDELGTGTDPAEGAALATAVLEHLRDAGALTLATSHLGQLKRLDGPETGFVNASLQFDSDRMEPTYRLVKGRPGRSFGLAIGRRLKLPASVMRRAEELVAGDDARQDALLERLEREERTVSELAESLDREKREAERLAAELSQRAEELAAREREAVESAHAEARQILLEARSEIEKAIDEGRRAAGNAEAARSARRRVEEGVRRHGHAVRKTPASADERAPSPDPAFEPGDRVRVSGGGLGRIVDVKGSSATVELDGGARMRVKVASLGRVEVERPATKGTVRWTQDASAASPEVDLRGLRVDEVEGPLLVALDRAVLADLPSLRIIHGKGTGAVKSRVLELLQEDHRIQDVTRGRDGEGGSGVTVVTLR